MASSPYLSRTPRSLEHVVREKEKSAKNARQLLAQRKREHFVAFWTPPFWQAGILAFAIILALSGVLVQNAPSQDDTITARDIWQIKNVAPAAGPQGSLQESK